MLLIHMSGEDVRIPANTSPAAVKTAGDVHLEGTWIEILDN
jgi:hypothetical protein